MARIKLGELLVQAGVIDQAQLQSALGEQKKWGRPLGRTLIELRMIDEKTLVAALSRQLNIPGIDLDVVQIPPEVLRYVGKEFCLQHVCLPFRHVSKGNFLDVAMSDPTNPEVFDRIRVMTRCNVRCFLAGPLALERALQKHFPGATPASTGAQDVRPWAASRPNEALFDLGGMLSLRTGEHINIPTEELELEAPRTQNTQAPVRDPGRPSGEVPAPASPQVTTLMQELDRLSAEVSDLGALLERDERVLRKLMALMVEKGLCSKQELMERINKE